MTTKGRVRKGGDAMPANTQDLLLKAAADLFYKKGYSGTSIREIGVKAGVSNSLLYHYFKNKEEILFQIISIASQELLSSLRDIEARVGDPAERLREMLLHHMITHGLRNKKTTKIVVEENYWLKGKRKAIVDEYQREIRAVYMKTLREMIAQNQMEDINLTVLGFSIFGMINWFFRWYKENGELRPEDIGDTIVKFIFNGISKK